MVNFPRLRCRTSISRRNPVLVLMENVGYVSGCAGSVLGRKLATLPIVKSEKKQPKVIIINYDSLMQGPQVPPPRKTRRLRRKNQRNKRCGPYYKFAHKRKMKCVTGEE